MERSTTSFFVAKIIEGKDDNNVLNIFAKNDMCGAELEQIPLEKHLVVW